MSKRRIAPRRRRQRNKTLTTRSMCQRDMALGALHNPELVPMPATRAECPPVGGDGRRRCVALRCGYHLALDTSEVHGAITINAPFVFDADGVPDLDLDALPYVCALDAAEAGGLSLEQVGFALGVTRERIRQIEARAEQRLRVHLPLLQECAPVDTTPPDATLYAADAVRLRISDAEFARMRAAVGAIADASW